MTSLEENANLIKATEVENYWQCILCLEQKGAVVTKKGRANIMIHVSNMHNKLRGIKDLICPYCPKTRGEWGTLKRHWLDNRCLGFDQKDFDRETWEEVMEINVAEKNKKEWEVKHKSKENGTSTYEDPPRHERTEPTEHTQPRVEANAEKANKEAGDKIIMDTPEQTTAGAARIKYKRRAVRRSKDKKKPNRKADASEHRPEMEIGPRQIRNLINEHLLLETEAPADGNCLYHAIRRQLNTRHTCAELRKMVIDNVHFLGALGAGDDVMEDAKNEAEEGLRAMEEGLGIPISAWGGGESACTLAYALNLAIHNYYESSGQMWPRNANAEPNGVIRILHLNWGHYRALLPLVN